jgi:phenylalanine-4-hydroxylase
MPLSVHELKLDGSTTFSRIMFSIDDYQTIYFVLKDCSNRFINDYNNTNLSLNVKLHMLNNDR